MSNAIILLIGGVVVGAVTVFWKRPVVKGLVFGFVSVAAISWWFMPKPAAVAAVPAAEDPVAGLERAVQQNPDDLKLRNDLAGAYLIRKNVKGVAEHTRYVLARSPEDARALTYQALVHVSAGQIETADVMLKRAIDSDPNLLDAWVSVAFLRAQMGKMDEAEAAMAEAKRRHPEDSVRIDELTAALPRPRA